MKEGGSSKIPQKTMCDKHKKAHTYICNTDKVKICTTCINDHTDHSISNLREECDRAFVIWADLKQKIDSYRSQLENLNELISPQQMDKYVMREDKFMKKFAKIQALKEAYFIDEMLL